MLTMMKPWSSLTATLRICPAPTFHSTTRIRFGACTRREERTFYSATARCIFSAAASIRTPIKGFAPSRAEKCPTIGKRFAITEFSAMRVRIGFVLWLCLLTCSGCGKSKSTDELLADLKSSQAKDRIIAVRLLQQRKRDAAKVVPALIEVLKDKESDIRLSAAIGLGYFGEQAKDAIPALQAAQHDRDARVREAAGIALSRI